MLPIWIVTKKEETTNDIRSMIASIIQNNQVEPNEIQ